MIEFGQLALIKHRQRRNHDCLRAHNYGEPSNRPEAQLRIRHNRQLHWPPTKFGLRAQQKIHWKLRKEYPMNCTKYLMKRIVSITVRTLISQTICNDWMMVNTMIGFSGTNIWLKILSVCRLVVYNYNYKWTIDSFQRFQHFHTYI